jgi:hypothetical protein
VEAGVISGDATSVAAIVAAIGDTVPEEVAGVTRNLAMMAHLHRRCRSLIPRHLLPRIPICPLPLSQQRLERPRDNGRPQLLLPSYPLQWHTRTRRQLGRLFLLPIISPRRGISRLITRRGTRTKVNSTSTLLRRRTTNHLNPSRQPTQLGMHSRSCLPKPPLGRWPGPCRRYHRPLLPRGRSTQLITAATNNRNQDNRDSRIGPNSNMAGTAKGRAGNGCSVGVCLFTQLISLLSGV